MFFMVYKLFDNFTQNRPSKTFLFRSLRFIFNKPKTQSWVPSKCIKLTIKLSSLYLILNQLKVILNNNFQSLIFLEENQENIELGLFYFSFTQLGFLGLTRFHALTSYPTMETIMCNQIKCFLRIIDLRITCRQTLRKFLGVHFPIIELKISQN